MMQSRRARHGGWVLFVVTMVVLAGSGAARAARRPIVAVFDIELKRVRLAKDLLSALWETMTTKLTESGRYQVVPRDKLKARLKQEKRRSYKRCYAKGCQLAIGRELAAEKTLSATITRVGRLCLVGLKVWDLRKATAERAAQAKGRCNESALLKAVEEAVGKLTGTLATPRADRGQLAPGRPARAGGCPAGQLSIGGHCCWPGQDWGTGSGRCLGKARCPSGFLPEGQGCRAGCAEAGRVLVGGHCCWPGQDWGAAAQRCLGKPSRCPAGLRARGESCAPLTKVGEQWVTLPAGSFRMGSKRGERDELPLHAVTLRAFALTKSEVTVDQYRACLEAGACKRKPGSSEGNCNWGRTGRGAYPVNCVDWQQAQDFCKYVGGRLPSEAEWEYAARSAGKAQPFPWGKAEPDCTRAVMHGSSAGCGEERSWAVCKKPKGHSAQGLCDLAGNVFEWVADCYQASYDGAPTDGSARKCGNKTASLRVFRGGCWFNAAKLLRAADRSWLSPSTRADFLGFRCAK